MIMMEKSVVRKQICSMILFLALVSFFFFFFPISESSSPFLLTIPIALLSTTILVTMTKKKKKKKKKRDCVEENQDFIQSEAINHEEDDLINLGDDEKLQVNISQSDSCSCSSSSSALVSDSESSTSSMMMMMMEGKSCEIDDDHKDQNPEIMSENDDDEDEDSLIEIDLLSSSCFYGGFGEEVGNHDDLKLPESIFKHRDLMGLLAESIEMNDYNYYEDYDNLIEIDISMDSTTKCSQDFRFKQEKLELLAQQ